MVPYLLNRSLTIFFYPTMENDHLSSSSSIEYNFFGRGGFIIDISAFFKKAVLLSYAFTLDFLSTLNNLSTHLTMNFRN